MGRPRGPGQKKVSLEGSDHHPPQADCCCAGHLIVHSIYVGWEPTPVTLMPEKRILQLCHEGPGAIIGGTITVGFLAALCQRMHRCQIPLWALWGSFLAMDKMATNSSILMKDILYDVWIGFGPLRIRDHTILK